MSENNIIIVSRYDSSLNINPNQEQENLQNQHFTATEETNLTWYQIYSIGFLALIKHYQDNFFEIMKSLPSDIITSTTYKYPILGVYELLMNMNTYWKYTTPMVILYFLTTTTVAFYYLLIVFPILLGNLTLIFGVFGIIIAAIQTVLEINAISLVIGKMMIFNEYMDTFFEIVLKKNGQEDFLIEYKKNLLQQQISKKQQALEKLKKENNKKSDNLVKKWTMKLIHYKLPVDFGVVKKVWKKRDDKDYWLNNAFPEIFYFTYTLLKVLFFIILSNIPIIGPILVMFLSSPMRTKGYMSIYFKINHYDSKSIRKLSHRHYGQFVGFGITASFIESLPYLSLFGAVANQVGAALWAVDLIKKQKLHQQILLENQQINEEQFIDENGNTNINVTDDNILVSTTINS